MPDFWSHLIGGELILAGLEESSWLSLIKKNQRVFNFGCQGPDFFLYHDFWPWLKEKRGPVVGSSLHLEKTRELFTSALQLLQVNRQKEDFPLLFAYVSGFLTHYALDKNCHPFINQKAPTGYEHKKLEIIIDAYLVEKYWGKKAYLLSPLDFMDLGKNLPQGLVDFYQQILTKVYAFNLDLDFIRAAYRDMKRALQFLYSPGGMKRKLFSFLDHFLQVDISGLFYPHNSDYSLLKEEEWQEFLNFLQKGIKEGQKLLLDLLHFLQGQKDWLEIKELLPVVPFNGQHKV